VKTTSALTVISSVIAGGVVLWGIQSLLIATGQPAVVPPWTWGLILGVLGVVMVFLARPIRRRLVAPHQERLIDPFYATRVLLLAKASVIAGSIFAGGAAGLGIVVLSRALAPGGSLGLFVGAVLGAIVLTVGGLVAERWCVVPPDSPEDDSSAAAEGEPA
jgi:hypothetical protein